MFDNPLWNIANFFLETYAFLNELVNLFLIVLDVIDCEYFTLGITTQQPQVLVCFGSEVFVDLVHYGGALALFGQKDIALDFLNNFYKVDLLGRDNVSDVGIDYGFFFEYLLKLEIDGFLFFILGVVLDGIET